MSEGRDFTLDRFQLDAIAELDRGHSVLVAAPTGSGKTVVAEAAIDMALASGGRAFYTTPIKALSNQKYADLCRRLGVERVGLLTGDNSIVPDAAVVVMTTEVLRNMIYATSDSLDDLHVVVLDEVHYLQDTYRGSVWEEVIIHLPANVRLVCLSATVSNATELGSWLGTVRGPTATIVETERPVELQPLYLVGDRTADAPHLLPILVEGRGNPDAYRLAHDPRLDRRRHGGGGGRPRHRYYTPRRVEIIERLADEDLLPAISFIFSRAACDQAAAECRDAGIRLTTPAERERIRAIAEEAVTTLTDDDLDALGYDQWLAALEVGVASHHAGLIPTFKEAVEACFVQGLVKVVFATETLALGINMPARSVVIERLSKYNGESHEFLTPGEFTQLTGRAGRRGLDDVGYAIVTWSPFVTFDQVVGLVASRSFPLVSSFRPTYNMAANLVSHWTRDAAYEVIGQSFAQYQADRAMVGLQRRLHEDRARLESLGEAISCERGDVADYAALVERARRAERRSGRRAAVEQAAAMLRPGELVVLGEGTDDRRAAVVISVAHRARGAIKVKAVDDGGAVHTLDMSEITAVLRPYAEVTLPTPFAPSDPAFLDQCAELVARHPPGARRREATDGGPSEADELAGAVLVHPVARCPDRELHLEALAESDRVERETRQLADAVRKRGGSLARRLDAVLDLLGDLGFVDGWSLTARGGRLARLYHESDLVIAEALEAGLLDGLDAAGVASVASVFTYEERRSDPPPVPELRHGRAAAQIADITRVARRVRRAEHDRGLPQTRLPDAGFAPVVLEWARGGVLGQVLGADLPAGDFVRNIKILVDLLRQIGEVAAVPSTAKAARDAADILIRGVVAVSSEVTTRETGVNGPER